MQKFRSLTTNLSRARSCAQISGNGVQGRSVRCSHRCIRASGDLYNSEWYLKTEKPYVSVGPAMVAYSTGETMYGIGQMASNFLRPRFLGGTKRPYIQVAAVSSVIGMQQLADMARNGKLKVPIDSCWELEDILKVCI